MILSDKRETKTRIYLIRKQNIPGHFQFHKLAKRICYPLTLFPGPLSRNRDVDEILSEKFKPSFPHILEALILRRKKWITQAVLSRSGESNSSELSEETNQSFDFTSWTFKGWGYLFEFGFALKANWAESSQRDFHIFCQRTPKWFKICEHWIYSQKNPQVFFFNIKNTKMLDSKHHLQIFVDV